MGKRSRDKGKRGELEAARVLAPLWPGLGRTYHQARGGHEAPDIDAQDCPVRIEVKWVEALNVSKALVKAQWDAAVGGDNRPMVLVHKRSRGPVLVTMTIEDLAELMRR